MILLRTVPCEIRLAVFFRMNLSELTQIMAHLDRFDHEFSQFDNMLENEYAKGFVLKWSMQGRLCLDVGYLVSEKSLFLDDMHTVMVKGTSPLIMSHTAGRITQHSLINIPLLNSSKVQGFIDHIKP